MNGKEIKKSCSNTQTHQTASTRININNDRYIGIDKSD